MAFVYLEGSGSTLAHPSRWSREVGGGRRIPVKELAKTLQKLTYERGYTAEYVAEYITAICPSCAIVCAVRSARVIRH